MTALGERGTRVFAFARAAKARADSVALALGYLSGALMTALAVFMTVEILSRYLGGPFTGITDEISAYVLSFTGTWAAAYALSTRSHVQIDVLVEYFPAKVQLALAVFVSLTTLFVAGIFAFQAWILALDSFAADIRFITTLTPVGIPQSIVAIGLTLLTVQAVFEVVHDMIAVAEGDIRQAPKTAIDPI
jgi:TRAP-type C4-dicarboxylate transport system permease small subunit